MTKAKFCQNSADIATDNGEITFIAARSVKNLNGYTYDVKSLQVQDAEGNYQPISSDGTSVAIPLMVDHGSSIREKVGNIDTARIETAHGVDQAVMHAVFFKTDEAQNVRQRILDGELTDVSITTDWGDTDYLESEDEVKLNNAHVIEVSVVYAGAEPKAKILAKNSVRTEGGEMANAENLAADLTLDDEAIDEIAERVKAKMDSSTSDDSEETDETKTDEMESTDDEESTNEVKESEMATQPTNGAATADKVADKRQVLNVLAKLAKSGVIRGMNKSQVIAAVKNDIVITDGGEGTYVVPDAVWTEILGSNRDTDILDTFKTTPVKRKTVLAEERSETDLARAGKYTKDELKVIESLKLVPKKLTTEFLYKLQKISYEDLQEDFGDVLYAYIKEELPQKVSEEEERDYIVGDGRSDGSNRHITSIVSLDAAAADATDTSVYNYVGTGDSSAVVAVMNGIAKLGENGKRYAVMNLATLTAIRQAGLDTAAGLPFSVDVVAGAIGVDKIFTREYVASNVVYVWTDGYVERLTGLDDEIEQYDIDYNNRKIEALRRVGGGAVGLYSAVKVTLPTVVSA